MNNDEMYNKYLLFRDQFEKFVMDVTLKYNRIDHTTNIDFQIHAGAIFSNLNLIYFENKINKLHNLKPTDRLEDQANAVFSLIPIFITNYTKRLTLFKK